MLPLNIFLTVLSPYAAVLPLFYMVYVVHQKEMLMYKNPWNNGLLFLFLWSLLSGLVNQNSVSAAASLGILLYFYLSIYMQNCYTDEAKVEKLFREIQYFSIGSAFIGIIEKLTATYYNSIPWGYLFGIPEEVSSKASYRIYSTFGNPNVAGTWFSAMVLVSFYFYENSKGKKKIFYGITSCLFVIVLYLTGSRGAAIGLLLGFVIYAALRRKKKGAFFLLFLFACVIGLMFVLPQLQSYIKSTDSTAVNSAVENSTVINSLNSPMSHDMNTSIYSRSTIWVDALHMFQLKPITGWGLLGIYYASGDLFHYHMREPHAHNIWLSIAATMGIVGLWAYFYMKRYLYEQLKLLYDYNCRFLPLLASIQALVIGHGLVDFTIMTPQGGAIFFGCSAIITALSMEYSSERLYNDSIIIKSPVSL